MKFNDFSALSPSEKEISVSQFTLNIRKYISNLSSSGRGNLGSSICNLAKLDCLWEKKINSSQNRFIINYNKHCELTCEPPFRRNRFKYYFVQTLAKHISITKINQIYLPKEEEFQRSFHFMSPKNEVRGKSECFFCRHYCFSVQASGVTAISIIIRSEFFYKN